MKTFLIFLACLFLFIGLGQAQVTMSGKGTGNTINITNDATTISGLIGDSLAQYPRTLESFGAVGDGATDDSLAIYNALNSGVPLIGKSGTTYYISNSITITDKNIDLRASSKEKMIFKLAPAKVLGFTGSATTDTTNLATDLWQGDRSITVSDGSVFAKGNLIKIVSIDANDWYISGDNNTDRGELHLIDSVLVDTLWLLGTVWDDYQVGEKTWKVIEYNPISVNIEGLSFIFTGITGSAVLDISTAVNNRLKDIEIDAPYASRGIGLINCYNTKIETPYISRIAESTLGYGIVSISSSYTTISNGTFLGNLKAIEVTSTSTYGVPSRSVQVINPTIDGSGFDENGQDLYTTQTRGVHTHGGAERVIVNGGTIDNCYYGVRFAGHNLIVTGVTFGGKMQQGVYIANGGGISVTNNKYNSLLAFRDTVGFKMTNFVNITSGVDTVQDLSWVIDNNDVYGISGNFVVTGRTNLYNVSVQNNNIIFDDVTGGTSYILGGSVTRFNSTVSNNNARALLGSIVTYQGTNTTSRETSWDGTYFYSPVIKADSLIVTAAAGLKFDTLTVENAGTGVIAGVRLGGYTGDRIPTLSLHNYDPSIVAGDTLGRILFGPSVESSLSNTWYPLGGIQMESQSEISGEGSAIGDLFLMARDANTALVPSLKIDGNSQVTEIIRLELGGIGGAFAVMDSAKIVADTLKFYVGGNAYNAIKGD